MRELVHENQFSLLNGLLREPQIEPNPLCSNIAASPTRSHTANTIFMSVNAQFSLPLGCATSNPAVKFGPIKLIDCAFALAQIERHF